MTMLWPKTVVRLAVGLKINHIAKIDQHYHQDQQQHLHFVHLSLKKAGIIIKIFKIMTNIKININNKISIKIILTTILWRDCEKHLIIQL